MNTNIMKSQIVKKRKKKKYNKNGHSTNSEKIY